MIDLDLLPQKKQYLYHLTSRLNLPSIIHFRTLFSASVLFELAYGAAAREYVRRWRPKSKTIEIEGREVEIRDQHTLFKKALPKCLDGMEQEDYYELLNYRVFLWPTPERLSRHYARYASEKPVLLRFATGDVLKLNPYVEFSRINSGATRPNSRLGGIAPRRGLKTFQSAEYCKYTFRKIAEVTVPQKCVLPSTFQSATHPDGPWSNINL
jgi:hypothetical protein